MKLWILKIDGTLDFEYQVPKGAAGEDLIPSVPFAETSPPNVSVNQVAVYESGQWTIKPDFRGFQYWLNGQTSIIENIGDTLPEGASFTPPEPTLAEKFELVRKALQSAIDTKAKDLGFSGGNALILYAGFPSAFQPLAQQFAAWEVSVWVEAETYKQEVIAGTNPMVTPEQAVTMMPTYA